MGKRKQRGHESRLVRWWGVFTTIGAFACGCGGATSAPDAPDAAAPSATSIDSGLDAIAPPVPFITPPPDPGDSGPGTVTIDDAAADVDPSSTYSVTLTTDTFT